VFFAHPKSDAIAGAVVFLVALPLCLGIAVACGVPPVSGLVAGIVGGIIVPLISRAPLSVTGPAAGLTSIVLAELARLPLEGFLAAVVLAGVLQVVLGLVRAGRFSALVPSSVIKGMLAAIGITILLKQLPVAFGVVGAIGDIPAKWHAGALLLSVIGIAILVIMPKTPLKKLTFLPAALVVVVVCTIAAAVMTGTMALTPEQFVRVPSGGLTGLWEALPHPTVASFSLLPVWVAAATMALVASIETLLSLQAVDRIDPLNRVSPPDRELVAQGVGNMVSGLLGGLPVTSVIVRSGANVAAGGRERFSAFVHGWLLLLAVVIAAAALNRIPLAALAAVLIMVGINLAKPSMFIAQAKLGAAQLVPFIATIVGVLGLDLLKGVIIGIVVALVMNVRSNPLRVLEKNIGTDSTILRFRAPGGFLSKLEIKTALHAIPPGTSVVVDANGMAIDHDVKELLVEFKGDATTRGLQIEFRGVDLSTTTAGGH
jgi:MFS superfamily sulfate permease-like transporter